MVVVSKRPLDYIRDDARRPSYPSHDRRPSQTSVTRPRTPKTNVDAPVIPGKTIAPRASQRISEGQQFRVGNIGQGGALYLSPVGSGKPTQQYPSSSWTLPSDLDIPSEDISGEESHWDIGSTFSSPERIWTPQKTRLRQSTMGSSTSHLPAQLSPSRLGTRSKTPSRMEQRPTTQQPDNVKVVVGQASGTPARPGAFQLLEVPIPHYRLGAPQFTDKGSAIFRNSIASTISGYSRSSVISSRQDYDTMFPEPPMFRLDTPKPATPTPKKLETEEQEERPRRSSSVRTITQDTHIQAGSPLQKDLHFTPHQSPPRQEPQALAQRDVHPAHRTVEITGATPTGLMAQITSPSDYIGHFELLHDFFLTFRAYISQRDLLEYLFHRLDWSIRVDSDFARIVKVRVFVALRHWLLNYFLEDFVLDRSLRSHFCELANGLATKLKTLSVKDGDRNICREIKKCYRDQLRLYWDIPRTLDPDVAVYPGGDLGSRDAMLGQSVIEDVEDAEARKRSLSSALARSRFTALPEHEALNTNTDTTTSTAQPEERVVLRPRHQYRNSDQSVDVAWCAMPRKALRKLSHAKASPNDPPSQPQPLGPRPVTPELLAQYPLPTPNPPNPPFHPQTPRRPFQSDAGTSSIAGHYGSPSFVNGASPAPTGVSFTGSLVRGMGVQPMSPKIVVPNQANLARSISPSFVDPFTPTKHISRKSSASPTPSLFGSVRRAFSTRKNSNASSSLRSLNISRASGRRSATPTPTHLRSVTPYETTRPSEEMPRIDVLAQQLLESFERAIHGQPPRTASDPRTVGETAFVAQNSGITAVPAAIPEVDHTRQSLVAPAQRQVSAIHDFAGIDDVIESDHETLQEATAVRLRGKHQHTGSAESAITDWSAGIRASHHMPREEIITEDVSPEDEHTDALLEDATARFNDAPILEISEDEAAVQEHNDPDQPQPLYLRNYRGFPHDMATKSTDSTQKSLDVETLVTDATDTSTDDPFALERITNRPLKRQPGGNLRAHGHVHSLMVPGQTQSMYSVEEDTGSRVPSMTLDTVTSNTGRTSTFNMLTTHSSQQLASMDPAFVAAAADLAALPDGGDDGGIEATLRKLEGRYEEPQEFTDAQRAEVLSLLRHSEDLDRSDSAQAQREDLRRHREEEVDGNMITEPPTDQALNSFTTGTTQPHAHHGSSTRAGSVSESNTSCSSLPLIERGTSLEAPKRKHSRQKVEDMLIPQSDPTTAADQSYVTAMESEYVSGSDPVERHGSPEAGSVIIHSQGAQHSRNIPSRSTQRSFLLDAEDDTPSILSMVADEDEDYDVPAADDMRSFYDDDDVDSVRGGDIPPHPFAHPKTPPRLSGAPTLVLGQAQTAELETKDVEAERKTSAPRHIPLQERVDYHARTSANDLRTGSDGTIHASNAIHAPPPRPLFSSTSNHYPFVLAYDSTSLAHQFTLIEKDALSDITWRELVDHHWSQTEDPHRNWADYLNSFSASPEELYLRGGIDICTTRFNLMVQWVISEILLTQDLHERASCISKFIQIASECRKIRNWATAIQLTMALTNSRVQRLTRTWSMVLDHDRQELQSLDILILPARNFSNIRTEQDRFRIKSDRANEDKRLGRQNLNGSSSSGSGIGCIPWMALYTRDLVANAQKPEYLEGAVAVTTDGIVLNVQDDNHTEQSREERVINVERMRTQAAIVRHFVDMKRASEEYVLRQVPELLSRCLWIAALSEEELERRSRSLE